MGSSLVLVGWLAIFAASAQDLRVIRISGVVNVRRDQVLGPGDDVVTGKGHADIVIDPAVFFRVQPNTEIRIASRDDGRHRVELIRGAIRYRVDAANPAAVEVATPQAGVWPAKPGTYQFTVNERNESAITAFQSDVEVVAARGSQWLLGGQKMLVRGAAPDPEFKIVRAVPRWVQIARIAGVVLEAASSVEIPSGGSSAHKTASTPKAPPPAPRQPVAGRGK